MVNVADIVTEVYSKLIEGVNRNSADCVFDALKLLKEEYLVCKDKASSECTLKQYIARKGLEQATKHVIGYKLIEQPDANHECITISLDDLADDLGEPSSPAIKALSNNIEDCARGNSIFNYKREKYHFSKSEQKTGKIGIVV